MNASFDLTDQVCLVTGGGSGIGLAMSEALAAAGATVVLWGRSSERLRHAQAAIKGLGGSAHIRTVDASDEGEVAKGFDELVSAFGRVDTVVANAGTGPVRRPFVEAKTSELLEAVSANLQTTFLTFREACRVMNARPTDGQRNGGSLVAVASLVAVKGAPRHQLYAAAKAGLIAMTKGIAVEHARDGIRANVIVPGWVATEMTAALRSDARRAAAAIEPVPMRRWGAPADFGGIAVYLASSASSFHTGDVITIDGGYLAA